MVSLWLKMQDRRKWDGDQVVTKWKVVEKEEILNLRPLATHAVLVAGTRVMNSRHASQHQVPRAQQADSN